MTTQRKLVDSKPLPRKYTRKELNSLKHEYRLKLKESGFEDIEGWSNDESNQRIIKGHIRWDWYKTVANFQADCKDKTDYFHILSLYSFHCTTIPDKYKRILQEYAQVGAIEKAIKNLKSTEKADNVRNYIKNNIKKMIEFVEQEFGYEA